MWAGHRDAERLMVNQEIQERAARKGTETRRGEVLELLDPSATAPCAEGCGHVPVLIVECQTCGWEGKDEDLTEYLGSVGCCPSCGSDNFLDVETP